MRTRYWLYKLQERLYCTEQEAILLVVALTILVSSVAIRGCEPAATAQAKESLAHMDSLFFALSARADSLDALGYAVWEQEAEADTVEFPIVLNTATSDMLQLLPRIGPALAARILDRRQRSGAFRSIDDLLEVPGIGPKTMERLRPLLLLNPLPVDSTSRPAGQPPGIPSG